MDAFADNFDQAEVDPAAEFLAREKDQLAGLEDELAAPRVANANNLASLPQSDGEKFYSQWYLFCIEQYELFTKTLW